MNSHDSQKNNRPVRNNCGDLFGHGKGFCNNRFGRRNNRNSRNDQQNNKSGMEEQVDPIE